MGLTLEESDNTKDTVVHEGAIPVLLDDYTRKIVEMTRKVKIDYHDSGYGGGFIVDSGTTC